MGCEHCGDDIGYDERYVMELEYDRDELLKACQLALSFNRGRLVCAAGETDRECLNRASREVEAALTAAIARVADHE